MRRSQSIHVTSEPQGATITVLDEDGSRILGPVGAAMKSAAEETGKLVVFDLDVTNGELEPEVIEEASAYLTASLVESYETRSLTALNCSPG